MPDNRGMQAPIETRTLAEQVKHSAECVCAVQRGQSLADVMPRVPAHLRPGVQALTFRVLRRLGLGQALAKLLAQRSPDKATSALLITGVVLLIDALAQADGELLSEDVPVYAVHTVVDQVVEAAKKSRATASKAAFLNGCLRRLMREKPGLMQRALASGEEAQWNHPRWWIERVRRDYPDQWEALLAADLRPGPMTIRVNSRQMTVAEMQRALSEQGVQSRVVGEHGLCLSRPLPVDRLPGFASGSCSVQDAAAQLAAPLLLEGVRRQAQPLRVLDACAAPGGKTAHLLELEDMVLTALDVDSARCGRMADNLARLGLSAEVRVADAGEPQSWWDGQLFDAILLDAPCSAAGIARRHPDVLWLRRETDISALATQQTRLLEALWPLLRPGGRLVYATCSVFKAEGQDQVDAFLGRHTEALARSSPGHLLPLALSSGDQLDDNESGVYDGFFYASLDKRDTSGGA